MPNIARLWPVILITAGALASACGAGSSGTGPRTAATGPQSAATAALPGTVTAATPTGGTTLTLSEKNNVFDKSKLTAPPGEVTFVLQNEDHGIPHNFHLYRGTDTSGQDMGNTRIEVGPGTQTLRLTLTAGEYYYDCDVHPMTAFGTLEVK